MTTPINFVNGEASPGKGRTGSGGQDCGWSVACVKFNNYIPIVTNPGHLENLKAMAIEQPAWAYDKKNDSHIRNFWTNTRRLGGTEVKLLDDTVVGVYRYLPGTLMHEFGHLAGLMDLYKEEYGDKYKGYLMAEYRIVPPIPLLDIKYLRQVYRNAHGSEPH